MSKEFTIEDSENLIANFQSITDGPDSALAAALRELANVPPLPKSVTPKVWPSESNVTSLNKFRAMRGGRRALYTTAIALGIGIGAAVGAAALSGGATGVIELVKSTVKVFSDAAQNVASIVTNNEPEIAITPEPSPTNPPVAPSDPNVPKNENGNANLDNQNKTKKSNGIENTERNKETGKTGDKTTDKTSEKNNESSNESEKSSTGKTVEKNNSESKGGTSTESKTTESKSNSKERSGSKSENDD